MLCELFLFWIIYFYYNYTDVISFSYLTQGESTIGIVVGTQLLGIVSFLLLSLLLFLSIGVTLGKLLQYMEVHWEGHNFHWYQDTVRVTLGPVKRAYDLGKTNRTPSNNVGPIVWISLTASKIQAFIDRLWASWQNGGPNHCFWRWNRRFGSPLHPKEKKCWKFLVLFISI